MKICGGEGVGGIWAGKSSAGLSELTQDQAKGVYIRSSCISRPAVFSSYPDFWGSEEWRAGVCGAGKIPILSLTVARVQGHPFIDSTLILFPV